jgi:hypothetical protein
VIQNQQLAQLNAELRALREENAEQRRLLEQARDAMTFKSTVFAFRLAIANFLPVIDQHLKGKP